MNAFPGRVVISRFRAKPGRVDDLLDIYSWHAVASHEEPALLTFALHQQKDAPDEIAVVESFLTEDDLRHHKSTPHYARSMPMVLDCIQGRPESVLFDPIRLGTSPKGFVG